MSKKFGSRTIFINHYSVAPDDARYILHYLSDGSYTLDEYIYTKNNVDKVILAEFPVAIFEDEIYSYIKAARKIIGKSKLYVECPVVCYDEDSM